MPKEYRVTGNERTYLMRAEAQKTADLLKDGNYVVERDVSEWVKSPPEDEALSELRGLRLLSKSNLEFAIGEEIVLSDNPYEMDTAILFYLIRKHGVDKVKSAMRELLGVRPGVDLTNMMTVKRGV